MIIACGAQTTTIARFLLLGTSRAACLGVTKTALVMGWRCTLAKALPVIERVLLYKWPHAFTIRSFSLRSRAGKGFLWWQVLDTHEFVTLAVMTGKCHRKSMIQGFRGKTYLGHLRLACKYSKNFPLQDAPPLVPVSRNGYLYGYYWRCYYTMNERTDKGVSPLLESEWMNESIS